MSLNHIVQGGTAPDLDLRCKDLDVSGTINVDTTGAQSLINISSTTNAGIILDCDTDGSGSTDSDFLVCRDDGVDKFMIGYYQDIASAAISRYSGSVPIRFYNTTTQFDANVSVGGALVSTGTHDVAGGAQTVSAAELVTGYSYSGAAGGAVALTIPAATAVQAELASRGITSAAGMRMPIMFVNVTDANNLTVTAADGTVTILGTAAINNLCASLMYVFTGAATAVCMVAQG